MAYILRRKSRHLKLDCVSYLMRCFKRSKMGTIADSQEIENFQKMGMEWWDPTGKLMLLHTCNELRIPFIINGLCSHSDKQTSKILKTKHVLDVGCGGGILSENLAKIGINIAGLDASKLLIDIAISHAKLDPYQTNLEYHHTTIEEYSVNNVEKYDAVIVSEVIEHITKKDNFLKNCVTCIKPGGSIFITTFSRTFWSWVVNKLILETITNKIPRGTHDWDKVISAEDVGKILKKYNCETKAVKGYSINLLNNKWFWVSNQLFSYALHGVKN